MLSKAEKSVAQKWKGTEAAEKWDSKWANISYSDYVSKSIFTFLITPLAITHTHYSYIITNILDGIRDGQQCLIGHNLLILDFKGCSAPTLLYMWSKQQVEISFLLLLFSLQSICYPQRLQIQKYKILLFSSFHPGLKKLKIYRVLVSFTILINIFSRVGITKLTTYMVIKW
jgi:hypothetical protein